MARKVLEVDVSSVLTNQLLNVEHEMGVKAQSITVVSVPAGVSVQGDWGTGVKVLLEDGDIIEQEAISQIWLTTTGTSTDKVKLFVSDKATFWKRVVLTKVAKYAAAPGDLVDQQISYVLTDIKGRLIVVPRVAGITLHASAARIANGNTADFDSAGLRMAEYCLDVTAVAGSPAGIHIILEGKDQTSGKYRAISDTTVTATGTTWLTITTLAFSILRMRWTTFDGVDDSVTFSCGLEAKG